MTERCLTVWNKNTHWNQCGNLRDRGRLDTQKSKRQCDLGGRVEGCGHKPRILVFTGSNSPLSLQREHFPAGTLVSAQGYCFGFLASRTGGNKSLLFCTTRFVVISYSCPGKQIERKYGVRTVHVFKTHLGTAKPVS